ncbi:MAG: sugar-binding protein, partial [Bacteroidota bacterium]
MKSTIIQTKLLRNLKKWRLFSLLTCLTLFLSPAGFGFWPEDEELAFSNGALAFAYPLSGITIDGDPSDWPQDLKRYPIQESVLDNKPKDNQDFEAYFQVGYELASQSIFVMVSIHDDDYVVNSTDPGDWLNQDSFNFYIDGHHNSAGSGLTLYQFNEKFRQIFNPEGSWDPTTNITTWEHLDYKIRRDGQKIYYELKVNIGKDMKVGKAVGMDFVIIDKDEDDPENFSFMTWGKGNGKSRSFGNLGDLFLMKDKGITPGQLSGKIAWADTSIAHTPDWLRVQSLDEKNLWLDVKTIEETGSFQVDLPPGNYEIKSYRSLYYIGDEGDKYKVDPQKSRVKVKVLSGKKTEASDLKLFKIDNPDIIPPKGILADFDPNKPQQVDNFIETYQKFYEIPGVSLALIKDGKLAYHKTYGYKNNFT